MIQKAYFSLPIKNIIATFKAPLLLGILATLTAMVPMAQAAYTPPEGDAPSGSTVAGGSRPAGCDADRSLPFTLLAPLAHPGYSTTTTPTLAWFVTATEPYIVQVSVYHTDSDQGIKQVYRDIRIEEEGGVGSLTLPEDIPLMDGEQYDWEVAIACDIDAIRFQGTVSAKLQVATPTEPMVTDLTTALTVAASSVERAEAYASRGYWFDALSELILDAQANTPSSNGVADLLRELGTLELANPDVANRGEDLLAISDALVGGSGTTDDQPDRLNSSIQPSVEPLP